MRTFRYLQTFRYIAVDAGFVVRGVIRAETKSDAIAQLLQRGYSRARLTSKDPAPYCTCQILWQLQRP